MANPEHVAKLAEGVAAWNAWRSANPSVVPDLSAADLSRMRLGGTPEMGTYSGGLDLKGALLTHVNLRTSDLQGAYLDGANLYRADLSEADFRGAALNFANLTMAILRGTNLAKSWLGRTLFDKTDLAGTVLNGAALNEASFTDVDLSAAKGLDNVWHQGPSTIGIDSFFRSHGDIPAIFLRGCGVPEQFITYARSLTANTIQFYSCFISYSTADQPFAERLHADLQAAGVRCWFAPHDIQPGKKIHAQIEDAIRVYDKLLLILSPASIASEWVREEILNAWTREKRENRQMLFPIALTGFDELRAWKCFDADTGRDVAREIREYYIPDFSTWKTDHDAYKGALDRVVKSLGQGSNEAVSQAQGTH